MIRYYDYIFAFVAADVMVGFFFGMPVIGAFLAYAIYVAWCELYCKWRLENETKE